jgi:DNA-binding CsgD family transcriptional regulator
MSHQMDAAWHRLMAVLYSDLDSFSLKQRFLAELRKAVPFDAAFVAGADPVTNLFTSSYTEEIPASEAMRFLHNELAEADVNKFRELSEERIPVAHLDRATQGERLASPRYREIMRPIGFGDELRAALRVSSMTWGYLCLHREDVPTSFTEAEAAFIAKVGPHMAEALRRAILMERAAAESTTDGPGVCLIAEDWSVMSSTPSADRMLAELAETDSASTSGVPLAVYDVVQRLNYMTHDDRIRGVVPRIRIQTRSRRWIVLHASRMTSPSAGRAPVVVVMEPATQADLASLIFAAYAFTPRESEIVTLMLKGAPAKQIASSLKISQYTVNDHIKAIFEKVGVGSRGQLAAELQGAYFRTP